MTLGDALRNLRNLDDDATIYAARPWTLQSEAVIEIEPDDGSIPSRASDLGCVYFLEVAIAKALSSDVDEITTRSLIEYAERDA